MTALLQADSFEAAAEAVLRALPLLLEQHLDTAAVQILRRMVPLELSSASAIGQPSLFTPCAAALQFLTDLAAPYLLSRPFQPLEQPARTEDELLPVIGRSMQGLVSLLRVFAQHTETLLLC